MSEPVNIPPRWRWATFGDVARVASDLVDPTLTPDAIHIAPNHIESGTGKLLPFATVATDKVTSPKHRFREGQLLYSKIRPYLAKVARATFCGVCSADMYPVDAEIDSGFLFHWLLSPWFTASASRNQGRTVLPKINQDALALLSVPVAPLPEQHRVAEKIDELFSDLDAGVASLERAKANLKRYRASVLKSAVEGRLTEEWRKEHPQAEDGGMLLDRILRERREKWEKDQLLKFKEKGKEPPKNWESKYEEPAAPDTSELPELPEGWVWATVGMLCGYVTSGSRGWAEHYSEEGGVFLRIGNLDHGTIRLDMRHIQHVHAPAGAEAERTAVRPGDVLISVTADVGMIGLAPVDVGEAYINQHISLCRPEEGFSRDYLAWCLTSDLGQRQFKAMQRGATKVGLGLDDVKATAIPLPPLAEQEQIVALVEERLSQIDSAEKTIDAELIRSKRLRQSILKRAFEGQLVPQDPKDEPATVLLERIKASREAEPPKKKAKKVKAK